MKHISILVFLLCYLQGFSQDPQISNYANNPLQLNPALTGQINGNSTRIQVGSRDQWRSVLNNGAFTTAFVSFDKRFCHPYIKEDYWALGVNVLGDQRGDFPLQRAEVFLSGVYMKSLGVNSKRKTYIGIGLEGGAIHHRLGKNDFTFDEQFDNPFSTGETFDNFNFTMLDCGVGLSLYVAGKDRKTLSGNIGGSVKHLGQPQYRFFDGDNGADARLNRRYVAHGGLYLPLSGERLGLSLKSLLMYQNPYLQWFNQADLVFGIGEEAVLTLGAGLRQVRGVDRSVSDALVVSTSLTFRQFLISFSYDTNISSLVPASSTIGAFELGLGFVFGSDRCSSVYCPQY